MNNSQPIGIYLGVTKEAVANVMSGIMTILNHEFKDSAVKCQALKVLKKVVNIESATISHCTISMGQPQAKPPVRRKK